MHTCLGPRTELLPTPKVSAQSLPQRHPNHPPSTGALATSSHLLWDFNREIQELALKDVLIWLFTFYKLTISPI